MVVHRPTPDESVTLFRSLLPFPLPEISKLSPHDQEEEEGLFKADAVNEEDPERDRATQV